VTNVPPSAASLRGAVDLSSLVRPPTPPSASAAPAPGARSVVVDADDASFTSILELSNTVPVIVELHGGQPTTTLSTLVASFGGRLVLARVDATTNPQLQQAFQAQVAPTVAAVVGGRPLALFEGELPEAEVRQVLDQLLALAAQNGVTGSVPAPDVDEEPAEPVEPVEEPLPPLHQAAYDAIERGDYPAAIAAYRTAITQDPRDQLAVAGLAQVTLLDRLGGLTAVGIRDAAAAAPGDVDAQLSVADLDVSGGHLEDAFDRLLVLFPSLDADGKNAIRTRMLDYFEIAGSEDPRVGAARRRLTALLY